MMYVCMYVCMYGSEERERFGGFRYKRLLVVADSDDLDTATAIEQYFELLAVSCCFE